jgi:hypothetical protein
VREWDVGVVHFGDLERLCSWFPFKVEVFNCDFEALVSRLFCAFTV